MSPQLPAIIRERRQAAGLTIEALAFASKLSVATVQRLETGKHDPTIATLDAVAGPLGTTRSELLAAGDTEAPAEAAQS